MPRSHGFLEEAVKEITARPGQTANEIARRLLDDGRATSTAENPTGSLVATLHKHHAGKTVTREWQAGQYRYYPEPRPATAGINESEKTSNSYPSDDYAKWLPNDCIAYIDALAVLPQFNSRHDVVLWLIRKGMESVRVN